MTKKELLQDPWVKERYGDEYHPNYINETFIDGVDYGERKAIENAVEWLRLQDLCGTIDIDLNLDLESLTKGLIEFMEGNGGE